MVFVCVDSNKHAAYFNQSIFPGPLDLRKTLNRSKDERALSAASSLLEAFPSAIQERLREKNSSLDGDDLPELLREINNAEPDSLVRFAQITSAKVTE